MTKTFQHLKQWQPTSIVSALSLESVRIVKRYEVHKRPKSTVLFETSFLLAKATGYPTLQRQYFEDLLNQNGGVFSCDKNPHLPQNSKKQCSLEKSSEGAREKREEGD